MNREGWFCIAVFGSGYDGPTGPYHSEAGAAHAYDRWFRAGGWERNPAQWTPRVLGPFDTIDEAMKASIDAGPVARDL